MIGTFEKRNAELEFLVERVERLRVGRAPRHDHLAALQIPKVAPDGPDRNHDLGAADKDHGREIDELAALQIVSGGAAFKIDRIIDDRLQPGFRRDLDDIDLEIYAIEQAPDLLHDGIADFDLYAVLPPGSIELRKLNRHILEAEPHRTGHPYSS